MTKKFKRIITHKLRGKLGEVDFEKKLIRINRNKAKKEGGRGEITSTMIHEELHAKHPNMKEKTVQKKEKQLMKSLSAKQKQKIRNKYKS